MNTSTTIYLANVYDISERLKNVPNLALELSKGNFLIKVSAKKESALKSALGRYMDYTTNPDALLTYGKTRVIRIVTKKGRIMYFRSRWGCVDDKVNILPYDFAKLGLISESEYNSSTKTIAKRFDLDIQELSANGLKGLIRELPVFSWNILITEKQFI